MNSREINKEVKRLAAERGWEEGNPNEILLYELFINREEAKRSLQARIISLHHSLNSLESKLDRLSPSTLNTLGELQQLPAAVETGVGVLANAERTLRRFLDVHKPEAKLWRSI